MLSREERERERRVDDGTCITPLALKKKASRQYHSSLKTAPPSPRCGNAPSLVRDVCDAEVEVRQLHLHEVPVDDLEAALVLSALHPPLQLQHLAGR